MSTGWRKPLAALLVRTRDLVLTLLIMGGGEILIALVVWPLLFRNYPQGFPMALSLVGFSVWVIASVASLGNRGRPRLSTSVASDEPKPPSSRRVLGRLQPQPQSGCGFHFFLSSFIPLALAFILRVRADLQAGYTWQELFPPLR